MKNKQKYKIILPDYQLFAFAGLWEEWVNPTTGEIIGSFTVLTKPADALIEKIHNSKKTNAGCFKC